MTRRSASPATSAGSGPARAERTTYRCDPTSIGSPHDRPDWLAAETDRLLEFARAAPHPDGGFAWLDDDGRPELDRPVELWITCRMTHVFALAHLMGRPVRRRARRPRVAALTGRLRDAEHGGWYAAVDADGPVTPARRRTSTPSSCSPPRPPRRPGGPARPSCSTEALDGARPALLGRRGRAWSSSSGTSRWTVLDDYRGVNANMHTVEALLAAADVPATRLRERAQRIVTTVVHGFARGQPTGGSRSTSTRTGRPLLDYNRDEPAHPFRPYGATSATGSSGAG